jgi:hypothetical protein
MKTALIILMALIAIGLFGVLMRPPPTSGPVLGTTLERTSALDLEDHLSAQEKQLAEKAREIDELRRQLAESRALQQQQAQAQAGQRLLPILSNLLQGVSGLEDGSSPAGRPTNTFSSADDIESVLTNLPGPAGSPAATPFR